MKTSSTIYSLSKGYIPYPWQTFHFVLYLQVKGTFGQCFRPGEEEGCAKKLRLMLSPVFLFINLTSAGRGPSQDSMISRIYIQF